MVKVKSDFVGTYIGEIVGLHPRLPGVVHVRILACTEYPCQNAIIFRSEICERKPFPYGSIQSFNKSDIKLYDGVLPEYWDSFQNSLKQAIDSAQMQNNVKVLVKLHSHLLDVSININHERIVSYGI